MIFIIMMQCKYVRRERDALASVCKVRICLYEYVN